MKDSWGMSCTVDIKECDLSLIRSKEHIQDYVIQLCKLLDMKRYGDCIIQHFGEGNKAGYSMVQLIETSCITAHFSNDLAAAFVDVFSCKDFNPEVIGTFTREFFRGVESTVSMKIRGQFS